MLTENKIRHGASCQQPTPLLKVLILFSKCPEALSAVASTSPHRDVAVTHPLQREGAAHRREQRSDVSSFIGHNTVAQLIPLRRINAIYKPIDTFVRFFCTNKPNTMQAQQLLRQCHGQDRALLTLPSWKGQRQAAAQGTHVPGGRAHRAQHGNASSRLRVTQIGASRFVSLTRFILAAGKPESFQQLTRKSRNCSRTL